MSTNPTFTGVVRNKPEDRVLYRTELCETLGVTSETVRRWINEGKIPKPDINLSAKTQGWRVSSLQAAGIGLL